ncbi:MAG TPA: sugar phosphate isomerase/epimerase [Verrucomicrobiales bacterium]|nr:sugar phosphate isomerase/epimerase [Verrucomicrobiales bacterium]
MNHPTSRRRFLCSTAMAGLTAAAAPALVAGRAGGVEPLPRSQTPRLRLGLAAYSFRQFFEHGNAKNGGRPSPSGKPLDMFTFVDYCAEHGCEGAELTSYFFPPEPDDAYLLRLKHHAHVRGVTLSGSAVGNVFTHPAGEKRAAAVAHVKQWIDRCALLGAPHIRVFAGEKPAEMPIEEARRNCIEALEEAGDHAARKGVFLGVENHGGIVAEADSLLAIVKGVRNPWIGINLDTGNFHTEDPYADLARCTPYAVNVQFKADMRPKGQPSAPADVARVLGILREGKYQGFVTLEYESAEDPWTGVPKWLGKLRAGIAGH